MGSGEYCLLRPGDSTSRSLRLEIVESQMNSVWERKWLGHVGHGECKKCMDIVPRPGLTKLWHACPNWHPTYTAGLFWYIYIYTHTHTHTYLTAYRLCVNYRYYQITVQWNIFTQIRSSAKFWSDDYRWGARLTVNGRICDIEHSLLLQQEVVAVRSLPRFLSYHILRGGLFF